MHVIRICPKCLALSGSLLNLYILFLNNLQLELLLLLCHPVESEVGTRAVTSTGSILGACIVSKNLVTKVNSEN
jgi:hypothetical protein